MHIEHINISAPADLLAQEKDFFCRVFHLVEGFRPKFTRCGYWLYHQDKALIHLTQSNEHFRSDKPTYLDHIAFQFVGLARLINTLTELSINYSTDHLPEIGMTQVFFKSPSGIGIEANFLNERL